MSNYFLKLNGLTHSFGGPNVLEDINLKIPYPASDEKAPSVCLMGSNGAGKSTLLDILTGKLRPGLSAKIEILGNDIKKLDATKIARLGIAVCLQEARDVVPEMSVFTNLCLIPKLSSEPWCRRLIYLPKRVKRLRNYRQSISSLLDEYGCKELLQRLDMPADTLSYGWRKIMSLMRVHLADARFILLDEPFAGLDPWKTNLIKRLIKKWCKEGRGILFVEHIRNAVMRQLIEDIGTRIVVLDRGKLMLDGPPQEILDSSEFAGIYMGHHALEEKAVIPKGKTSLDNTFENVMEYTKVKARYDGRYVLHVDDFRLKKGDFVLLVGPNGSGKSTLLGCVSRIGMKVEGLVRVFGKQIDAIMPHKIARMGVGFVPQKNRLFSDLTVEQNLAVAGSTCTAESKKIGIRRVLKSFSILKERLNQRAGTLSSGEQAQLSLAIALVRQLDLLLADELSIGLDSRGAKKLQDILVSLLENGGSVLLAEQNYQSALRRCDDVIALREGQIIWRSEPRNFTSSNQRALFSGTDLSTEYSQGE